MEGMIAVLLPATELNTDMSLSEYGGILIYTQNGLEISLIVL